MLIKLHLRVWIKHFAVLLLNGVNGSTLMAIDITRSLNERLRNVFILLHLLIFVLIVLLLFWLEI